MKSTNDNLKGILYASISAILWGFLAIVLKITVAKVPPLTIVWFRFSIAFTCLLIFFIIKKPNELKVLVRPDYRLLIPAVFLALNYSGYMIGIYYTTPNNAQVFIQFGPVILAASGFLWFKEKLGIRQVIGFIAVITGFYFFYSQQVKLFSGSQVIYNKGVLFVLFGAVMWAGYAVSQKKLVINYPTRQLNLFNFGLPVLLLMPLVDFRLVGSLSYEYFLLLLFLGLNTLVAYTCISLALKYTEANKVSIIATSNPIITFIVMAILGYMEVSFIHAEIMNCLSVTGAALVITGAVIVAVNKKK